MSSLQPPAGTPLGYYPVIHLPEEVCSAPALAATLSSLGQQRIWGIDLDAKGELSIEDAYTHVVDQLIDPEDAQLTHRRLVALALTLAVATQSWMRRYTPDDPKGVQLTDAARRWLQEDIPYEGVAGEALYPMVATRHQHLDESREVHRCLSQMLAAPGEARQLLLDILDVTLDGYAIFPGMQGRRDLFNWWLSEAVPAAFMARLPEHIYSADWPWPPAALGS